MAAVLNSEIESRREQINALCERFGVRRLELFGSAASDAFDPATSDFDFLVEFDRTGGANAFRQYFGLKEGLEALLGRAVDLVEAGAPVNRYFLQSLNKSRRLLYAA